MKLIASLTFKIPVLLVMLLVITDCFAQDTPLVKSLVTMTRPKGMKPEINVQCMVQDKTGRIWFGTSGAGLYSFKGKVFTRYTEKDGLMNGVIFSLMEDHEGRIWAGTNEGVYIFDGHKFNHFTLPGLDDINYNLINSANIVRFWYRYKPVFNIVQDKTGNIWIGTAGIGLYRYDGNSFTNYRYVDGKWKSFVPDAYNRINCNIYGNPVNHMLVDKKGDLLFGSAATGRLFKHDGNRIISLIDSGRVKGRVMSMVEDKTGRIWLGTELDGAYSLNGRQLQHYTAKDGLRLNTLNTLLADKKGDIWFGSTAPLNERNPQNYFLKYDGKTFARFPKEDLINTSVTGIFEDKTGNIWISGHHLNLYKFDGQVLTDFTDKTKPPVNSKKLQ